MATKKKQPRKKIRKKNPFTKFVNFTLSKSDREEIKASMLPPALLLDRISEMIEAGYSFKLAYDIRSECLTAMMIGEFTDAENKGCIMAARHTDVAVALNALLYQHITLSDCDVWDKEDLDPFVNDW